MTDFIFLTDVLINLNTGFVRLREQLVVMERRSTTMRYLNGWFPLDLVASLPYELFTRDASRELVLLRMLRILRIFKLYRLLRMYARLQHGRLRETALFRKLGASFVTRITALAFFYLTWCDGRAQLPRAPSMQTMP